MFIENVPNVGQLLFYSCDENGKLPCQTAYGEDGLSLERTYVNAKISFDGGTFKAERITNIAGEILL